jgi:hypothetical protein
MEKWQSFCQQLHNDRAMMFGGLKTNALNNLQNDAYG